MASIRTARVLATLAATPLLLGAVSGVAHAVDDNAIAGSVASGVGDDNNGNYSGTQQAASGLGASNESNTVNVNESAFTFVDQSDNTYYTLVFDVF
ncbi:MULTISPECIES: hypothetical protein [Streptomyces]|uniref:Secreted protein n=2 Tax=Streptomyces TaxID=1883 RepID=A0A5N6A6R6_9ACTN|nr:MULTISPECIES: hypothetical protein [Streptomyces]KAB8163420.1 hypothetical protein FH607_019190 [Streptomyces mimosae]KAB8174697.1 hypothetical protein FH609_021775 [Streptomyces sp. 3MP-14]RMI28151.1 hypothetical protein EBN88_28575 [Streptomyces triticirhizae]